MVEHLGTETVTPVWCLPDEDPAVPLRERERRAQAFRMGCLHSLDTDCEQIKAFCDTWRDKELYRDFAPTWDGFCVQVLQIDPAWIDRVCEGLRVLRAEGHAGEVSTAQALSRAEQAQAVAADETVLASMTHTEAGTIGGRGKKSSLQSKELYGNGQSYLIKRLKRDAPLIAEALARGEFSSARAAAKAAGIVHEPTPLDQLHKYWRQVSIEDRLCFLLEMLTPHERRVLSTGLFPEEP